MDPNELPAPLHRDDLPMELAEAFVEAVQKEHPGVKVIFAGDAPGEIPQEIQDALMEMNQRNMESLVHGLCIDCGRKMENWPDDPAEGLGPGWQPADGWRLFTNSVTDEPSMWQCPECDAKEGEGSRAYIC